LEITTEAVDLQSRSEARTPAYFGPTGFSLPRYKRPLDLTVGILLLALCAPLAILVAIIVKATSRGPVLFRQQRLGKDGRPFTMYKFRTMHVGAAETLHREYFEQYQQGIPAPGQKGITFKLQRDPRITPLGGPLRRFGLDELPQLFNVIKGDMSLVGPRPPLPYEVERYSERDLLRMSVRPGMTGLWQIKGRDMVSFGSMIDLDLEYVERQTLGLDLAILLSTVPALVWSCVRH
jgi:lipopolysaccharide/colanic/teichoic acid biosynthesis glycosyltransferase